MRIHCPNCSAAYDVPTAMIAGRKAVRCARCKQQWEPALAPSEAAGPATPAIHQEPEEPDREFTSDATVTPDATVAPTVPLRRATPYEPAAPTAMQRLALQAVRPRSHFGPRIGWIATVLVLALSAWSALAWRGDVMHAWPPSTRLYAALGLTSAR